MQSNIYQTTIDNVTCVSKQHKVFNIPVEMARRHYGIKESLLVELEALGLPFLDQNNQHFYDRYDLTNISLYANFTSIQRMAMRTWAAGLKIKGNKDNSYAKVNLAIETSLSFPRKMSIIYPGKVNEVWMYSSELPAYIIHQVKLFKSPPQIPALLAELLTYVANTYHFYMLPESLRWDTAFIRKQGIAECGGASKLLYEECRQLNFECRQMYGVLLAAPYSITHFWLEVKLEGQWYAFDPVLINLLTKTIKVLDQNIWQPITPLNCVFFHLVSISFKQGNDTVEGPIFNNVELSEHKKWVNPLITCDGVEVPFSLKTNFT